MGKLATRLVNGGLTHIEGRILGDERRYDALGQLVDGADREPGLLHLAVGGETLGVLRA